MTKRGVGSLVLSLAVLVGVAACDDNPLAEARDTGAYIDVNPVNAVVEAGDTTPVFARVMSRYQTPTNDAVTAEPCDSKITAEVDPKRSAFEVPENFLVIGQTLGNTCLVVRGGGLVDTAGIRVVPAGIELVGDSLVQSGETATYTVRFLNTAGQAVTGFDRTAVTFTTVSSLIGVVDADGVVSARAPGTTGVVATLKNTWGVIRQDTLFFSVVAGQFAGTFSPASPTEGSIMTINAGALPFDSDTQVLVNGVQWGWVLSRTPAALTLVTPPTGTVIISNIGVNQVSLNATIPVVSHEPADNGITTARVLAETDSMWFSVSPTNAIDMARLVVPAGGATYRFTLDWNPTGGDLDIVFFNSTGGFMGYGAPWGGCATGARPEGCTVAIPAGTWYPAVELYSGDPTTAKMKITKQ